MNKMKLFGFLLALCAFLPSAGFAQALFGQENETLYQFFVWLKTGEKTGYLTSERPEWKLNGDVVTFWTKNMSVDIPQDELDKFTIEQVQPGEAPLWAQAGSGQSAVCRVTVGVPLCQLVVWTNGQKKDCYDFADKPGVSMSGGIFTVKSAKTTVGYKATDILKFTLEDSSQKLAGDVNGDGAIDVADISAVILVMARNVTETNAEKADVNGDGTVDVADIATIISIMAAK